MAYVCPLDYRNACRICLSNRGNLPIFGTCNDELGPLSQRILACLSVEVCQNDDLPKQICHRCDSLMNVWYYFKIECDRAQQKLKKWYLTVTNTPRQLARCQDGEENFILREVVNIKLEPEDESMDVSENSIIVGQCLEGIHSTNIRHVPENDVACRSDRCFPEDVAMIEAHSLEHQSSHPDSLNLVITETSSVALNVSDPGPLSLDGDQDELDDENLIRLAIESDGLDSDLHQHLDGNEDDINITYVGSGNTNRPVLEITIDDSSDGMILPLPTSGDNEDVLSGENRSIGIISNDSLECRINLQDTLLTLKKEPTEVIEVYGIQIKKEIEDSNGIPNAMPHLDMITPGPSSLAEETSDNETIPVLSAQRMFRCSFCKLPFRTSEQKVAHEARKHMKAQCGRTNASKDGKSSASNTFDWTSKGNNYQSVKLPKVSNELFDEATTYCKSCKRRYNKGRFWRHIKSVHIQEDPFKCGVCKKIFPGRRELVNHRIRTVSKYCREGHAPNVDLSYIITHQEVPRGQTGRYECRECSNLFMQLSLAKSHIRLHTGEKPFFCYKCNIREFHLRKSALKHVAVCEGDGSSVAPKGNVKLLSKNLNGKAAVLQSKKSVANASGDKGKPVCIKCNKIFGNGVGLSNHLRTCKGVRKCFTCLKFISRRNFKRHSRFCIAQNVSPPATEIKIPESLPAPPVAAEDVPAIPVVSSLRKNAPLKIVNKSVAELNALHMDSDGKFTNFVCKLCDKTMSNRRSLYAHLLKHSGEFFKCKFCKVRMRQRATYESHMAKLHGIDCKSTDDESKLISVTSSVNAVKSKAAVKYRGFKNLKCEVCQKLFSSATSLKYHKQSHKKVKCLKCEITFTATMERSHICAPKTKTDPDATSQGRDDMRAVQFTCHLCKKKFHTRKMLYQHKKMHIKVKIYKCKICDNSYSDSGALQLHKKEKHPEELLNESNTAQQDVTDSANTSPLVTSPWGCSICQKSYSGKDSWSRHMKLHNGGRVPMFIEGAATAVEKPQAPGVLFCSLCNRAFNSKVSFLGHKGWHSRQQPSGKPPEGVMKSATQIAQTTVKKSGSNTSTSMESVIVKSNQDVFKCSLCSKKFSSQKNLNCHVTYHKKGLLNSKSKGSKQKATPVATLKNILPLPKDLHRCQICSKSFLEESSLLSHIRIHLSDAPDTACDQKDPSLVSLKQEPMTCKLCNKEYRSLKSLNFHMMDHSVEKPFKCRSCSNRYSNSNALAKHEKERHSSVLRPFSCNRCKTSFMVKEDLLAHFEKCTH